jgi:CPA1 family monovalent cation:H+ antiporter
MAIANKRRLPYPVLLVVAGLIIGFIPQLPDLELNPEVIFVIILPPLLYDAASKTSWYEFRASIRPISALAITLVFFTTVTVAVTAHYLIPGFSWPLAFVLGAVISPPDAVAASGIIKGLGLNKRVITILEGESLVNDASALIAYRYAVTAVATGSFVFWKAGLQFLLVAAGGIAIGLVIGYLFSLAHKKIENNPVVETSLTLLLPFAAYLGAEHFHLSGVLAVVSAGLLISWRSHEVFSYQARMRTRVIWETLIFLLEGFVFILIGLQLKPILHDLNNYPLTQLLGYGLLISIVTIVVRIIWVFAGAYGMNLFQRKKIISAEGPDTVKKDDTWKNVMVVAWTGTRGIISLAAALALPLLIQDGSAFPKRHSIIFLAFVVIFVTLIVQGLTLPLLIRWLHIKPQRNEDAEAKELQLYLASNTLHYIEEEMTHSLPAAISARLKKKYETRIRELNLELKREQRARNYDLHTETAPPDALLNAELLISKFQRDLLLKLHKADEFSGTVLKHVERELDINELKLDFRAPDET